MKQREGFCVMKKEVSYRESVKEAIAIALVHLLEEKSLSQITILEIVERAGVGRSSFYRNFDSKETVLLYYLENILEGPQENLSFGLDDFWRHYIMDLFRRCKAEKRFLLVLKRENQLYLFYRQAQRGTKRLVEAYEEHKMPYQAAFYSSAAVGVMIQWIENGFQESEEELTDLFISLLENKTPEDKIGKN